MYFQVVVNFLINVYFALVSGKASETWVAAHASANRDSHHFTVAQCFSSVT